MVHDDAPMPDVDGGVGGRADGVGAFDVADASRDVGCLREFVTDCVKPYSYISFHARDDGELVLRVFQILAHPRRITVVKTVGSSPDDLRRTYNAVSLGVWLLPTLGLEPSQMVCHEEQTEEIDIASLMDGNVELRSSFRTWTRTESDYFECFTLRDPVPFTPTSSMDSAKFPILALWDAINASDYVWLDRKFVHKLRSPCFLDLREKYKRPYMQCILSSKWIFGRGQPEIHSRMPIAYYQLLLRKPGSIPADLTGADYKSALTGTLPEDQQALAKLIASLPKRPRVRPVDDDIDGDDPLALADADPLPIADPSDEIDGSSRKSSSSTSSSSSNVCSVDGDSDVEPEWPEQVHGDVNLKRELHADTGDVGLRVKCSTHDDCRRFRSIKKDTHHFGPRAAQFFLGCWLEKASTMSRAEHRGHSPRRREIKAYIESLD